MIRTLAARWLRETRCRITIQAIDAVPAAAEQCAALRASGKTPNARAVKIAMRPKPTHASTALMRRHGYRHRNEIA